MNFNKIKDYIIDKYFDVIEYDDDGNEIIYQDEDSMSEDEE